MQRRLREAGRIRIGSRSTSKTGKQVPSKLESFRFTSQSKRSIDLVAHRYGGAVQVWKDSPGASEQYEVFTEARQIPIFLPPYEFGFSQWYESWTGSGCTRRCDGVRESISDSECLCDPGARECKPHTRLSVILVELDSVGLWRLDTQGYYAAAELLGASEMLNTLSSGGRMVPARLVLTSRSVSRPGEPRRDFVVPGIDIDVSMRSLLSVGSSMHELPISSPAPLALEALGESDNHILTPVETAPMPSVAEQIAAPPKASKPRSNSAQPIKSTGLKPRRLNSETVPEALTPAPQVHEEVEIRVPPSTVSPPPAASEADPPITPAQVRKMQAMFGGAKISPREEKLVFIERVLGRKVESSKDLSKFEAALVIDNLQDLLMENSQNGGGYEPF